MTGPLYQAANRGPQIHNGATLTQATTTLLVEDGAAAGCKHDALLLGQVADDICLTLPKAGFTLDLENQRNRGAGA